jgi:hypothetical protein
VSKEEVRARLAVCCRPLGAGDSSFIVSKQEPADILGSIWFEGGRIKEVRRDVGYSGNPEVAHFTLELFRLLSGAAYSKPAVVKVQTVTHELSNGSSKSIVLTLVNGRNIRTVEIELASPDDKTEIQEGVTIREGLVKR